MKRVEVPFDFNSPDDYMEIKGHDVRLSILKMRDFSDTLGLLASYSLMYTRDEEYKDFKTLNETQINCLKRIYLKKGGIYLKRVISVLIIFTALVSTVFTPLVANAASDTTDGVDEIFYEWVEVLRQYSFKYV